MVAILTNPLKKHGKGQRGPRWWCWSRPPSVSCFEGEVGTIYENTWNNLKFAGIYRTFIALYTSYYPCCFYLANGTFFWNQCIRSEIFWSFSIHSQGLLYEQRRINTFSKVATICVAERTFDHQKKAAQLSSNRSSTTHLCTVSKQIYSSVSMWTHRLTLTVGDAMIIRFAAAVWGPKRNCHHGYPWKLLIYSACFF